MNSSQYGDQAPHTHRFDDGTCTRCGASHTEVLAARSAKAQVSNDPQTQTRRDMDAVAAENDRRERNTRRQDYYRRTGR